MDIVGHNTLRAVSPADAGDVVGEHGWSVSAVDVAVGRARDAQPAWDALGLDARIAHVERFGAALSSHADELADIIAREMGKPLREARAEVGAVVSKVGLTIREGLAFTRDWSVDDGRLACRWRPHGVLAVLGPFNFPLHLPHGHIVPALLAGNTVVFKPSEVTPTCAARYAEIAAASGLPAGVLSVVQGDGSVGAALAAHDDIDGVLFTGSYEVGTRIAEANLRRPGVILALEMGGRNAAVVCDDAPFDKALLDVVLSAFSTTGQRCTCASRLIVTRGVAERFIERVVAVARALRVGHPYDPAAFMGPLASPAAVEKFTRLTAAATRDGLVDRVGRGAPDVHWGGRAMQGCYVAPTVRVAERAQHAHPYLRTEVFGPDLAVLVADDVDEALALANDTPYGLAAGVWTRSRDTFERAARTIRAGCVTWNAPTVGSSSRLPFGGLGHSGNHRPAGIFSSMYCAWPQAVTLGTETVGAAPPGVILDTPSR